MEEEKRTAAAVMENAGELDEAIYDDGDTDDGTDIDGRTFDRRAKPQNSLGRKITRGIFKALGVVLVMALSLCVLALGAITVICKGPFPASQNIFVVSVLETSAVKFLAYIYYSPEEVAEIVESNSILPPDEITDTDIVTIPPVDSETIADIEIIDISGSTYKGKMMIIHDPSRVRLATIPTFGAGVAGMKIERIVEMNGAVAGINGGGFDDPGGAGLGGMPQGLLIHDGVIRSGSANTYCNVIGLTYEHKLVVGEMTGQDALNLGVRDAVFFEPTLIVNGKPSEVRGAGGGVNPRTCIGQRADGAILFLVIDGRQPHSVGATMQDCLDIMLEYEAVNAANLDGGSSSVMVYNGEIINVCSSLYGSRNQPAAFIVDAVGEEQ